MRRLRFLVAPGALAEGRGSIVRLPEDEARHLRVTLRGRQGMEIYLFDGEGAEWRAEVEAVSAAEIRAVLLEAGTAAVDPPLEIVVLQAVSRDEAFESALEQMTCLGAASIVPLLVDRSASARPPNARRLARWRRIVREASKLSWRRTLPQVHDPAPVSELAVPGRPGSIDLLLDVGAPPGSLKAALAGPAPPSVRLAVGPEGGFTPAERCALLGAGFAAVSIGPRVLRTEHAGPAALALILAAWGDVG